MSNFIFPLITFPYVSRVLTAVGTGKVQFATSLISYFTLFCQLGIPMYGVRVCAQVREDKEKLSKTVKELFLISLFMTVLFYVVFLVALFAVPRLREERTLYLIMSTSMFFSMIGMEWLYKALEQYTYITIRSIAFKLIALLAMFALVHDQQDYIIYGGISIFASSASSVLNFLNVHRYVTWKGVHHLDFRKHMKPVFVFFAMSCATTIYTNLDTVMLGFMKTDADVGYYGAAVKIKNILVSIVTSLGTVLLPRVSFYVQNGERDKFEKITAKALQFVFLVATPMMLYFMLFADCGIHFLSGSGYEGAILPMRIIMPTLLFIGLTNIMGIQVLVPLGREKIVLYSEIAGALVDLVINAALIPRFASAGAAFGTLVAEIVVFGVQYYALRDLIRPMFAKVRYGYLLAALALGTIATLWVRSCISGDFLVMLAAAICFFGVYGIVLTVAKEPLILEIENKLFAKLFKWRKHGN
jgi:O-antigen/teichoic acid export membrane protein